MQQEINTTTAGVTVSPKGDSIPNYEMLARNSVKETFVVFKCSPDAVAIVEPTDAQYDDHFEAEFKLIDALGEFRGISCHPVYGLGHPDREPDDHDPPFGIRLVAGSEGVLEHFLWHVYAELYNTAGPSKPRVASDFGVLFLRYEDRCSVLIEYGIGDVDVLLRAVELTSHCIGHSDFHRDHAEATPSA